ncbi:phytoene dehydrogenase-like protein [Arthrobacter sp. PvP023]|uniref:NAD(P)/FAD-dependent oxidoreductase n=1 Tax=Micrococcaceae TaxID=1268 RepID=UPI001AE710CF|nr:NAD(P)/FAD-dependent oxidoreductase [Arthrobacter sp. PvP023]MBP1134873.1 phytoene dehydrogenase-like protein [Arthrobacter sp. PvP023]
MTDSCEVLVVGAGLAGLQCARELQAAGRDVQVWEADDDVGGRIRTEQVDGFLVDRGFQVLNPAYPAVRRWVDVGALELQPFGAGLGVRRDDGFAVLAHPLREPRLIARTVGSGIAKPRDAAALLRWAAPAFVRSWGQYDDGGSRTAGRRTGGSGRDVTLHRALDDARLSGELRRVVEQFFAGVLLEDDGSTSNDFALLLLRTFALGVPGLPRLGMQALPRQLAASLAAPVRTRTTVESIRREGGSMLVRAPGAELRAEQVVLATDPVSAGSLAPGNNDAGAPARGAAAGRAGRGGAPAMKGVLTHWFAASEPPSRLNMLCLDAREPRGGPLVNTAVVSNAAPGYAPAGRHLVQTSALFGPGRPVPGDDEVRNHAAGIYGEDATHWELVARHEVPQALPAQPPPLGSPHPAEASPGLFLCGDYRATASIQGALESGHRAAQAILRPDFG